MRASVVLLLLPLLAACVTPRQMKRSEAQFDLGTAYYREGNVEGAITTLQESARLDPRAWKPWNALAVAYIAKGETDLADAAFRHARRIAPGEAEILNNHGTLLLHTGRTDDAIEAFTAALNDLEYRNPALIYSNLAYAYLQAGKADEALRFAREATRRAPTMCQAWYHVGLAQEAKKDALSALEAYRQVQDGCPDALGAQVRVGCIQVQVGETEEGAAVLDGVLRAAPGTALADQSRACLRTLGP